MYTENPDIDILMHYGTPRHSGRYPWGSGKDPYQHQSDFLSYYRSLHAEGLSDTEIARQFEMTTTQLRAMKSIARDNERTAMINQVKDLKDHGYSNVEIGKRMSSWNDGQPLNESTIRSLLNAESQIRTDRTRTTAELLKDQVAEKKFIDIGTGVEKELNITDTKLKTAAAMLEAEGYNIYNIRVEQATNAGRHTTIKVLCPPGTEYKDVYKNINNIKSIKDYYSTDNGETFTTRAMYEPKSIDISRVGVRYAEDGGADYEGVMFIRPGVNDVSLGKSSYSQVRIAVDDKYYLKGMAMYNDDLPEGVDILFNTKKSKDTPIEKVFKPLKDDPDNPFGATIASNGQSFYEDKNGEYIRTIDNKGIERYKKATGGENEKRYSLNVVNKVNDEGTWTEWSRNLPSQFLSKQSLSLINKQLDLSFAEKMDEYDEIMKLENPVLRKKLLESFSDDCDASAVHLKAAALPRQASHVILPVNSLKDNEVYAPNYKNGETVVLVRFPHEGTFQIPELVVNNKNAEGRKNLGNVTDAIGINAKVAEQMSGADFDGDSVLVIPCNSGYSNVRITARKPLPGLKGYDAGEKYQLPDDAPKMTDHQKGVEMGRISNLITDMTLQGATDEELTRAVKHSMCVIDAQKHHYNYKQSEIDNDIQGLREKYQKHANGHIGGAATLISKSKGEVKVPMRSLQYTIDPETGEKNYKLVSDKYLYYDKVQKDGTVKRMTRTSSSTRMAEAKDAMELSNGHPKENAYAKYANKLKELANKSRIDILNTPNLKYDPEAKKKYKMEVDSLKAKLDLAQSNAPRERQAQIYAKSVVDAQLKANPGLRDNKEQYSKLNAQALAAARIRMGSSKKDVLIDITPNEWEAIQAGAVSSTTLRSILDNTDIDIVRQYAMPRTTNTLSEARINRIKAMDNSGNTTAEIADALGISTSTVQHYLKGDN